MTAPSAAPPGPGMAGRLLRLVVPRALRRGLRTRINELRRSLKAPAMVWGYRCASGAWRPRTRMSDTVFLYHPERIEVADDVFVWHYTILDGTGGLSIGEGSQIGAWVGIFTHSSHLAIRLYGGHYHDVPEAEKVAFNIAPVRIGRYVFVGAGSKVLPGVTIGDGSLVAAGSIVNHDVEPFSVVAGNPAKVVGSTRKLDEKYLEDPQLRAWHEEWQHAGIPGGAA